jgi:hypothetical protein
MKYYLNTSFIIALLFSFFSNQKTEKENKFIKPHLSPPDSIRVDSINHYSDFDAIMKRKRVIPQDSVILKIQKFNSLPDSLKVKYGN